MAIVYVNGTFYDIKVDNFSFHGTDEYRLVAAANTRLDSRLTGKYGYPSDEDPDYNEDDPKYLFVNLTPKQFADEINYLSDEITSAIIGESAMMHQDSGWRMNLTACK